MCASKMHTDEVDINTGLVRALLDRQFPQRAIYRWIDGQLYADGLVDDERRAATDLAQLGELTSQR